ncbi:ABC transporter ATP-binding protein [Virgibacillus siamensis]|uniref:ABC transporter ATP-binding protein n=1 Tax=Virgibacillus siamensis TaxID=480071 RepID=UPI0009879332|nr:ABC transporter ATP-binding protein [Virgibacillus siamensis]
MSFLALENISHHYFSAKTFTKALDNITFSVKEGQITAVLGPSGCGKSTLLSIISGEIQQTEGNVLLDQKPLSQSEHTIGLMLEHDYLFPRKTIIDNVLIGPKISGQLSTETKQRAVDLLYDVGLSNVSKTYPNELSKEMRQRVAFIRTLITDPKILLMDEPFSALDYQTKLKLQDLFAKTLRTYHKTTLLVTHDIEEAIAMSDRIIVMESGSIDRIYDVPIELREEKPFFVRRHPKFRILFEKIWEGCRKHKTDPFY